MNDKLNTLKEYIKDLGSLAVGFSGGVDSTFLLAVAHEVLGDKAIAVTGIDASVPEREIKEAKEFCKERGIRQFTVITNPLEIEGFRHNDKDRCYYCKHGIFSAILKLAHENGIEYAAEGSNLDDLGDYRPGLRAVAELGVKSPLRECGLTKADIRELSKEMGLPTWSKPSYACLASRFVYGEEISEEKLLMIDKAEQFLIENGFPEERVRIHGNLARIEVPAKDIERLSKDEMREAIYKKFKEIGFLYVTIDIHGYKMGSMNATIDTTK
ncbi:MAG: ATP-dependent sacrificial sulfur transferase LarE [Lachnospiraceae bacterium]|nr:ATP-dependent sacrificial sulfur transferase LarE [Lachnospiraceae bacterium]